MKLPEWLDENFLKSALSSYTKENIRIVKFEVAPIGESQFATTTQKIKIYYKSMKYTNCDVKVINVKSNNDVIKNQERGVRPQLETEITMFQKTLPSIRELLKRCGAKIDFLPELIYATNSPAPILLLQDMSTEGFEIVLQPLKKLKEAEMVLKRLAQFHAASFYIVQHGMDNFSNHNYCIFKATDLPETRESLQTFRDVVASWNDCEGYLGKLDSLTGNFSDIGNKCFMPNSSKQGYNVLNLGDFRMKNIMVKRNQDREVESLRFLDFGTTVWCSPAIDIFYVFFNIVVQDSDGCMPRGELLMYYHQEFVRTLEGLSYLEDIPTLLDLNLEIMRHSSLIPMLSILFIPYTYNDFMPTEDIKDCNPESHSNLWKRLLNVPSCKSYFQREMKNWVNNGWM